MAVAPAQFGHTQVGNTSILRPELPLIATTAGLFWAARHDGSLIASTPQIGPHLFVQGLLQCPFDRLQGSGVDLSIDLLLDIARQGAPVHNLHVVGKVASVMKLRCMAHRDILRGSRLWLSWFYRMSRVDAISRNHPYTTQIHRSLAVQVPPVWAWVHIVRGLLTARYLAAVP